MEQLQEKLGEAANLQRKRAEFAQYVENLKNQEAKGLISVEQYRKLITEWNNQD
jgi:hypothetical protein